MSDLVRFGVAMERALLAEFDDRIAERGYENRSEALRDLVRADLTKAAWETGERVTATWTLVLAKRQRADVARALDDGAPGAVTTRLSVPLDAERDLEVLVVKGRAGELTSVAGRIGGMRGVLRSDLTIASVERERERPAAAKVTVSEGGR